VIVVAGVISCNILGVIGKYGCFQFKYLGDC
jgi:hypothetical protein